METVYIETTIVSYLTARPNRDLVVAAHQHLTREWWEARRHSFGLRISQAVITEAAVGDVEYAKKRLEALVGIPLLDLTQEALALSYALVHGGPLPPKATIDAIHIATATVHGVDYLLTWNCKHIANAAMRPAVLAVCRAHGFEPPVICTPEELMGV
jgi:hypothetical protein